MPDFKISIWAIILMLILCTTVVGFETLNVVYAQFFDDGSTTFNPTLNSTSSDNTNLGEVVLLSQKLNKTNLYSEIVGEISNCTDCKQQKRIVIQNPIFLSES